MENDPLRYTRRYPFLRHPRGTALSSAELSRQTKPCGTKSGGGVRQLRCHYTKAPIQPMMRHSLSYERYGYSPALVALYSFS